MIYKVPGVGEIELTTIVLDLNGTLSIGGKVVEGVKERVDRLKEMGFDIVLLSGDQRGTADAICQDLSIRLVKCINSVEKEMAMELFPVEKTVAIGNSRIDLGSFRKAKVRIATLQNEGMHTAILAEVDILVPSINAALDLLSDPDSFAATMRV